MVLLSQPTCSSMISNSHPGQGGAGIAAVNLTGQIPTLKAGSKHVFTVVQDHMGLEQNYGPGGDLHKVPYDSGRASFVTPH